MAGRRVVRSRERASRGGPATVATSPAWGGPRRKRRSLRDLPHQTLSQASSAWVSAHQAPWRRACSARAKPGHRAGPRGRLARLKRELGGRSLQSIPASTGSPAAPACPAPAAPPEAPEPAVPPVPDVPPDAPKPADAPVPAVPPTAAEPAVPAAPPIDGGGPPYMGVSEQPGVTATPATTNAIIAERERSFRTTHGPRGVTSTRS